MMHIAVLIAILLSLIFFSYSYRVLEDCRGATLLKSQTFFFISITFVRFAHWGQLANSVSFWQRKPPKEILLVAFSAILVWGMLNKATLV